MIKDTFNNDLVKSKKSLDKIDEENIQNKIKMYQRFCDLLSNFKEEEKKNNEMLQFTLKNIKDI